MTTDLSGIDRIANKLRKFSTPAFRSDIMGQLAQVADQEMTKTRGAYSDPHGRPWRQSKSGNTGLGRLVPHVDATAAGVSVEITESFAGIHQRGGIIVAKPGKHRLVFNVGGKTIFAIRVKIPPRVLVPRSIPRSWLDHFKGKLKATVSSILHG